MEQVFGWWLVSSDRLTLVNRVTGQRLRLVGPVPSKGRRVNESALQFVYEDDEVDYPIIARWMLEPSSSVKSKQQPPRYGLHVDHVQSAARWRQSKGAPDGHPPFGLWRRVDDCLTDALACWTDLQPFADPQTRLTVGGGWLNGEWCTRLLREYDVLTPQARAVSERYIGQTSDYSCSRLMSINEPAPSPWRFHPFVACLQNAEDGSGYIESLVRLMHSKSQIQFGLSVPVRVVPAGVPLTGIEGHTAYFKSVDGERVLYPVGGTDKVLEDRRLPEFTFEIVDADFSARLGGRNQGSMGPTGWVFGVSNLLGGHRREEKQDDLWIRAGPLGNFPSYALWRRIFWAITDGWLYWQGTEARNPHWADGLLLAAADSVSIEGLYLGGEWLSETRCLASFASVEPK